MNKSLELVAVFRLDRYYVPAVTHCNEIILKILKLCTADVSMESLLYFVVGISDFSADVGKFGAGLISYEILGDDRSGYSVLQRTVSNKSSENGIEGCLEGLIGLDVIEHTAS